MKRSEFISNFAAYLRTGEFEWAAALIATAIGMTEDATPPEGAEEQDCCAALREELKQARLERAAVVVKCNEEVQHVLNVADGYRRDLEEMLENLRAAVDASARLQEERDAAVARAEAAERERATRASAAPPDEGDGLCSLGGLYGPEEWGSRDAKPVPFDVGSDKEHTVLPPGEDLTRGRAFIGKPGPRQAVSVEPVVASARRDTAESVRDAAVGHLQEVLQKEPRRDGH